MSIEQSQINACLAWQHAGYSALAIATALNLAPGTVRKAVFPATKFGKTQLPVAWLQRLEYPFPKSYVPNLSGVYQKFLRRMAVQPPMGLPALTESLLPCTFPDGQLQEWQQHYKRLLATKRVLSLVHFNIMKDYWQARPQKLLEQIPPASAEPEPCDRLPQSSL